MAGRGQNARHLRSQANEDVLEQPAFFRSSNNLATAGGSGMTLICRNWAKNTSGDYEREMRSSKARTGNIYQQKTKVVHGG